MTAINQYRFFLLKGMNWGISENSRESLLFVSKHINASNSKQKIFQLGLFLLGKLNISCPNIFLIPSSIELPIFFEPQVVVLCKNRIKVFDLKNYRVFNTVNSLNNFQYVKNEIQIRRKVKRIDIIAPSLLEYNLEESWFIEELIKSVKKEPSKKSLSSLFQELKNLFPPIKSVELGEYSKGLIAKINDIIKAYNLNIKFEEQKFVKLMEKNHNRKINLGYCHADCCAGNIFNTDQKPYGIAIGDWEYSRLCSSDYDIITYAAVLAMKCSDYSMLDSLLLNKPSGFEHIMTGKNSEERIENLHLVILERMAFDSSNMPKRGYSMVEMEYEFNRWMNLLSLYSL